MGIQYADSTDKFLDACSTLLLKLHNADQANLAESFKSRLPELLRATTNLQDDVRDLEGVVEIIDAVSAGINTITGIVNLLA